MAIPLERRKLTGSYYTDIRIAQFLAQWAIRSHRDRVLEPSFGAGAFLHAIEHRFAQFQRSRQTTPVGVDLNVDAVTTGKADFPSLRLLNSDFFALSPNELGFFDVVLGNPPFVRYHHFSGEGRKLALRRSEECGVKLSELASAWAPFLLHSMAHLRSGGRLSMVVPYEITYALYARPVVQRLAESFRAIRVLTFEEPLFPELNERTVLLLADGYGRSTRHIAIHHFQTVRELSSRMPPEDLLVEVSDWISGEDRASLFRLPRVVSSLYRGASRDARVARLGDVARVNIGYVTGNNQFFHLTRRERLALGIPPTDTKIALRKGSDLNRMGLTCTGRDLESLAATGAHHLFSPKGEGLGPGSDNYVNYGVSRDVHKRYKCRVRSPWYVVPGVREPDMFLPVMMTAGPRLVANRANAVATNSLLLVDRERTTIAPEQFAAAALTSLAQLSAEIEGHALGGGALKFEPGEARRWLLPVAVTPVDPSDLRVLDQLLRSGRVQDAEEEADRIFLLQGLGWTEESIRLTRRAISDLRQSRKKGMRGANRRV